MTVDPESVSGETVPSGPVIEQAFRASLQRLRGSLMDALESAGVEAGRPRQAARALGLDKTLMWRISRIVAHADVFRTVGHVPHRAGFEILGAALARAGVPDATLAGMRASAADFERLVERHAGDRATFELMAAGFGRGEHVARSLERGRKLAFRGNSAVWGVQARLQLSTGIMLPSAEAPGMVDMVHVFGFVDLRRLRDDGHWTLSHRRAFGRVSPEARDGACETLDGPSGNGGDLLIRPFCTTPFPELLVEEEDGVQRHVLPGGAVGRTGEMTALFGCRYRALGSQYATRDDPECLVVANLLTPVEHLQFDLLVHEDLEWALDPQVAILGCLDGRPRPARRPGASPAVGLPCAEDVVDLGRGLHGTSTPRMPGYGALLSWVFERIAADPEAFRALRFELPYPPMPAEAVLRAELLPADSRPGAAGGRGNGTRSGAVPR